MRIHIDVFWFPDASICLALLTQLEMSQRMTEVGVFLLPASLTFVICVGFGSLRVVLCMVGVVCGSVPNKPKL